METTSLYVFKTLPNSSFPYRFCGSAVCASVAEAADTPYTYVIVTTKALPELYSTAHMLQPIFGPSYKFPQPTYVLLQNGLGVEKDLNSALCLLKDSKPRIYNTSLWIYTNLLTDNMVECNSPVRDLSLYQFDC